MRYDRLLRKLDYPHSANYWRFLLPHTGIIDGAVLTAVGELLMFGVIAQIPRILDAVRNGKSIKVSKGDFGVEVTGETKDYFYSLFMSILGVKARRMLMRFLHIISEKQ